MNEILITYTQIRSGAQEIAATGWKASETHSLESKFLGILGGPGVHGPIRTVGTEDWPMTLVVGR